MSPAPQLEVPRERSQQPRLALRLLLRGRTPDFKGRVIFLSGDTIGSEVATVASRDGNPVLSKPFTLESVRAAMAAVLLEPVEPLQDPPDPPRARNAEPSLDAEEIESPVVD